MVRLFLFLILVAIIVAIVAGLVTIVQTGLREGQRRFYSATGGMMERNGIRKIAYVGLIILLFGVSTGWLGGL